MARPTDPAKLAALRARQAVNSANYRARQRAAAAGRVAPADRAIVQRAVEKSKSLRERRAALIRSLPNVNNPRARLRPVEQSERAAPRRTTRKGQQRQAQRIMENANAKRLTTIGRARKEQLRNELETNPTGRLEENMTPEQRKEFQRYSEIIAKGSQQSVAILFEYANGQELYSAALERILASPTSRDVEEGLSILSRLAELAQEAAVLYSPANIGRVTV